MEALQQMRHALYVFGRVRVFASGVQQWSRVRYDRDAAICTVSRLGSMQMRLPLCQSVPTHSVSFPLCSRSDPMDHRSSNAGGRVSILTPVLQAGSGVPSKHHASAAMPAATTVLRPRSAVTHPQQQAASAAAAAYAGNSWIAATAASPVGHGVALQGTSVRHARGHSSQLLSQQADNFVSHSSSAATAADAHMYSSNSSSQPHHSRSMTSGAPRSVAYAPSPAFSAPHVSVPISHATTHSITSPVASSSTAATATAAVPSPALPHPNAALLNQIQDQWSEYMDAVAAESAKGVVSSNAASVSSLPTLLGHLHSNALLNFFEFTSARSQLCIWGPSFDCLYYHAPVTSAGMLMALQPSGIYRDRADYTHTLSNLLSLTLRNVDWSLVSLHLPLLRQRATKLRHLTLEDNNISALWQLDPLAMLAPTAASQAASTGLESVTIKSNAVCEAPLYRSYLISLFAMNAVTASASTSTPRNPISRLVSRLVSTSLQRVDGVAVTDREILASVDSFASLHRSKYFLPPPLVGGAGANTSPSSSDKFVSSKWLEMLYESSIAAAGGAAALGTAANPMHTVSFASPFPAASCLPLPIHRPLVVSPAARRSSKKLVEELLGGAMDSAARSREFEQAWTEAMHEDGGVIEQWMAQIDAAAIGSSSDAAASVPGAPSVAPLSSPSAAPRLTASAVHSRATLDKVRLMRLFHSTPNPSAILAAATIPLSHTHARKRR